MAKKMALVPPELVSEYYQITKPEIRLEDNIANILQEKLTSDDVKAKLLSDLIPKYQRAMQVPPPPKPFEIPSELLADLSPIKTPILTSRENELSRFIGYGVPKTTRKFILPILEKLRQNGYTFNEQNELEVNGKAEYRSNVIDLFSYMMKNERNALPPRGFNLFFNAIHKSNIPLQWIRNKYLRDQLILSEVNPRLSKKTSQSSLEETSPEKWERSLDESNTPPTDKGFGKLSPKEDPSPTQWQRWKD